MSFRDVSVVLAHGAWGRWVELVLGDRPKAPKCSRPHSS